MKASTPHFLLFSESSRKDRRAEWRFVLQSIDGSEQFEAADAEPEAKGERLELLAVVRGLEALPGPAHVTLVTPSRYVNRGLAYGLKEWRANGWQWEHFGEMVPVKNRDLWQRIDRALEFHRLECRAWRFDLPHAMPGSHLDNEHHDEAQAEWESIDEHPDEQLESRFEGRSDAHLDGQPRHARLAPRRSGRSPAGEVGKSAQRDQPRSEPAEPLSSAARGRAPREMPHHSLSRRLRRRVRLFGRWTSEKGEAARLRLAQFGTQLLPLPWFE